MGDTPINLENILEQAPKWTFAGDFTLLQWMKQISQDLECRALKTTEALTKLNNNVKSTNIALDNVANRLTTLQFGNQFVECRVQDDDETFINSYEQSGDTQSETEPTTTPKELLNTFLDNNLKVLRNCHERYSIDLEDSDDEETSKEETCIYQPINPYNERPLPYIFGSKDWLSKWHVGLYENQQDNSYSGDEISEAFSESSSTSHLDDNESFESNTEWASSNSIENDNLNANIEVKNASSFRGSQPLYPGTPIPINAAKSKAATSESSSVSTASSSMAKRSAQGTKQNESLPQRPESAYSVNSKNSTGKEVTAPLKTPTQNVVDLFAEPPADTEYLSSSSVSSAQNLKHATVENHTIRKNTTPALRPQPPPFVDLFAEPPEDFSSSTKSSLSSSHNIKRKIVNLFDDDKDNMTELIKDVESKNPTDKLNKFVPPLTSTVTSKPLVAAKISKSLFDDSDEDDDFLKAFVKNTSSKEVNKRSFAKTLPLDGELDEHPINSTVFQNDIKIISEETHSSNKGQNIFDEIEENDFLSNKPINVKSQIPVKNPNNISVPVSPLLNQPIFNENIEGSKRINLFDDLDDEDNLFSGKPENTNIKNVAQVIEESTPLSFTDATVAKDIESKKHNENQLKTSNNLPCEEESAWKEQIPVSKPTKSENGIVSHQVDNKQHSEEQLFEPPQQELSQSSCPTTRRNEEENVPIDTTQKTNSLNKYEFNSILFSDEPPDDDDEFFETLSKAPSALNTNYNTIDLENDIFEPDLPKVPVASSSNNQTDTTDNFYTGLQLFSDIPPDDDDVGSDIFTPPPDTKQTKRLHNVFYDDFNETIMALNQKHIDKDISNHSIFNDGPPATAPDLSSISQELTDKKVPDIKHEIINVTHKTKSVDNDTKLEEALQQTNDKSINDNKRPVSKLQMPHININVQALLPGANNTLRRSKDNDKDVNAINTFNDDITAALKGSSHESQTRVSDTHLVSAPRSSETEHILPNMTRNRVKAPSARRPSTRRARQENYRKSLIEQQAISQSDDENPFTQDEINKTIKTIIPQTTLLEQNPPERNNTSNHNKTVADPDINVLAKHNRESLTKDLPESSPKDPETSTSSLKYNHTSSNDFKEIKSINEPKLKPKQETNSLLFADQEEDDDFFKHIRSSNSKARLANETQGNLFAQATTSASASLLENNTSMEITTKERLSPYSNKKNSGNIIESGSTAKEQLNQQTVDAIRPSVLQNSNQLKGSKFKSFLDYEDEDDDLFTPSVTKTRNSVRNKDTESRAKAAFKSFLDSETDEEPPVAGLHAAISATPTTASFKKIPIQSTKYANAKLFSDSETDSDDLFGKVSSTKTSNYKKVLSESTTKGPTKAPPQASLFEDDSDSDDFLTPAGSLSKKPATSKNSLKKNVPKIAAQTNTSLFSDLDTDEDDLFGGVAAKMLTTKDTNVQNVKTPLTSQLKPSVAENFKTKTVDDNPLADLL